MLHLWSNLDIKTDISSGFFKNNNEIMEDKSIIYLRGVWITSAFICAAHDESLQLLHFNAQYKVAFK